MTFGTMAGDITPTHCSQAEKAVGAKPTSCRNRPSRRTKNLRTNINETTNTIGMQETMELGRDFGKTWLVVRAPDDIKSRATEPGDFVATELVAQD